MEGKKTGGNYGSDRSWSDKVSRNFKISKHCIKAAKKGNQIRD